MLILDLLLILGETLLELGTALVTDVGVLLELGPALVPDVTALPELEPGLVPDLPPLLERNFDTSSGIAVLILGKLRTEIRAGSMGGKISAPPPPLTLS